jgi:taurine dioxygenase
MSIAEQVSTKPSSPDFHFARPQNYARPTEPYALGPIEVIPSSAALGAEIRGVDFTRPVSDAAIATLHEAWADHLALVWRDQRLSIEDHMRVGRIFGELEDMSHVYVDPGMPPVVLIIDNEPDLNKDLAAAPDHYRAGFQAKPVRWHSDNSYREVPPRASIFYMRVAAKEGGITHFQNMYAAYNDLPADLLAAIEGRWAKHDRTLNSGGTIQKGRVPPEDVSKGEGIEHPLVRVNPLTGRKALYLGRRPYQYICGYTVPESEALLDRLWAHAEQEKYVWRRPNQRNGDLILWDNRCAMHSRDSFKPEYPRLAHRVQVLGEPIVAPWPRKDH